MGPQTAGVDFQNTLHLLDMKPFCLLCFPTASKALHLGR